MNVRLRAPAEHGAVLFDPPPENIAALLDAASRFDLPAGTFGSLSFREWRDLARREALAFAKQYCSDFDHQASVLGPWFVAGHQPDLFHPGVWLKNFVLAALAKRHRGVAINLVVDNDTLKHRSIRVPIWHGPKTPPEEVLAERIAFDNHFGEVPFEDATVQDTDVFRGFAQRLADVTHDWPESPIAATYWQYAQQGESNLIGERFAAARRELERAWGARNLELPVSMLAGGRAFANFAQAILRDLPRFHAIYNRRVREYRAAQRIRSNNHPVPDLGAVGDLLETPFWAWRVGDSRRGRLLVRMDGGTIHLQIGAGRSASLSLDRFADEWCALLSSGFKVRPRALTTTLFARMALSDVFMHGIGGAIYDTLADSIGRDFFGIAPPPFIIVSGTLRLPLAIDAPQSQATSVRDLTWKPQLILNENKGAESLIDERHRLIAGQPATKDDRRERYRALRANLERLAPFVAAAISDSRRVEKDTAERARADAILSARDYSFLLHSERELRQFFSSAADRITS